MEFVDSSHMREQRDMTMEAKTGMEKCGICCIPIAARGVLDCCSDIFCFSCIDTWSAFTNLCPLCKLQFKSITFVPVADDEDSSDDETQEAFYDFLGQERVESWNVDVEEDGALSFPSYFIEEDAVVCLDGDGCCVRKGISEGVFSLEDTSVACDACDCWYHASCVGYKPDLQGEKSWICPRCVGTGVLDLFKFQPKSFSSKVTSRNLSLSKDGSIDLLDEGETAVVVSMDACCHPLQQSSSSINMEVLKTSNETLVDLEEDCMVPSSNLADLSLDTKTLSTRATQPMETATGDGNLPKSAGGDMEILKQASRTDSTHALDDEQLEKLTQEVTSLDDHQKCGQTRDTELIERSAISLAKNPCQASIERVAIVDTADGSSPRENQKFPSPDRVPASSERVSPVEITDGSCQRKNQKVPSWDGVSANVDVARSKQQKMKQVNEDGPLMSHDKSSTKQREPPDNLLEKKRERKKQKLEERRAISADVLGLQAVASRENSYNKLSKFDQIMSMDKQEIKEELVDPIAVDEALQDARAHIKTQAVSIQDLQWKSKVMDDLNELVQGLAPCHKRVVLPRTQTKGGEDGKAEGVRTRKIVYRGSDLDGKASKIVKEMQQHLKETSLTGDVGKLDVTDEKFFVAFKAAVQSSQATARQQQAPAKRAVLRRSGPKDRSRQSLMKKLYGGTGKRRQAWDRDWDVSFWRDRVSNEKKAKQSSKSLLQQEMVHIDDTIRNSQKAKKAELDSLRSRIYLADTSLLPRQSDVKSLSEQISSKSNAVTVQHSKPEGLANMGKRVSELGTGPESLSAPAVTKGNQEVKMDKRRWALGVLARKTGQPEKHSRGKRSLLLELPQHMRPILEYDRRSKVPTSTRQVQLDRFVEFYLQEAALDLVQDNPECAAAVSAAVDKEKEIYGRSNSKVVYVNLCIQALASLPKVTTPKAEVAFPHEAEVALPHEAAVESSPNEAMEALQAEDMAVLMAWKATGLISDSPPHSPVGDGVDHTSAVVVEVDGNLDGPSENLPHGDHSPTVVPVESQAEHSETAREMSCSNKLEETRSTNLIPDMDSNAADSQEVKGVIPKADTTSAETTLKEEASATEWQDGLSIDVPDQKRREKILGEGGLEQHKESGGELHGLSNNVQDRLSADATGKGPAATTDKGPASTTNKGPGEDDLQEGENIDRIGKQVEAYVKEHIRPLHRSHVITTEQYRWAVAKTTNKVMQHHTRARSADFLIAEGEKVKRLAEQYLQLFTEQQLLGTI